MNLSEHYALVYSMLVGLTLILYIKKWGELLQVRSYSIYVIVPLLWSLIFVVLYLKTSILLVNTTINPMLITISMLTTACYYWIGMLAFPNTQTLNTKDQFAYLDYYEHFRKQHFWVIGLALVGQTLTCIHLAPSANTYSNYLLFVLLSIAFFTEHKGLMCLLGWLVGGILLL